MLKHTGDDEHLDRNDSLITSAQVNPKSLSEINGFPEEDLEVGLLPSEFRNPNKFKNSTIKSALLAAIDGLKLADNQYSDNSESNDIYPILESHIKALDLISRIKDTLLTKFKIPVNLIDLFHALLTSSPNDTSEHMLVCDILLENIKLYHKKALAVLSYYQANLIKGEQLYKPHQARDISKLHKKDLNIDNLINLLISFQWSLEFEKLEDSDKYKLIIGDQATDDLIRFMLITRTMMQQYIDEISTFYYNFNTLRQAFSNKIHLHKQISDTNLIIFNVVKDMYSNLSDKLSKLNTSFQALITDYSDESYGKLHDEFKKSASLNKSYRNGMNILLYLKNERHSHQNLKLECLQIQYELPKFASDLLTYKKALINTHSTQYLKSLITNYLTSMQYSVKKYLNNVDSKLDTMIRENYRLASSIEYEIRQIQEAIKLQSNIHKTTNTQCTYDDEDEITPIQYQSFKGRGFSG